MTINKKPFKSKDGGKTRSSMSETGLKKVKGQNFYRDAKKAAKVKMLTGGKPVYGRDGKIKEAAAFQKGEKDAPPGRVQPDRRWFGEFGRKSATHISDEKLTDAQETLGSSLKRLLNTLEKAWVPKYTILTLFYCVEINYP